MLITVIYFGYCTILLKENGHKIVIAYDMTGCSLIRRQFSGGMPIVWFKFDTAALDICHCLTRSRGDQKLKPKFKSDLMFPVQVTLLPYQM
jgi:hypothetical protein